MARIFHYLQMLLTSFGLVFIAGCARETPSQPVDLSGPAIDLKPSVEADQQLIQSADSYFNQIQLEIIKSTTDDFHERVITDKNVTNYVDTESGPYDALRKHIGRVARTAFYTRRYIFTSMDVQLSMLEAREQERLQRDNYIIEHLDEIKSREYLIQLTKFVNSIDVPTYSNSVSNESDAFTSRIAAEIPALVPAGVSFGLEKGLTRDSIRSHLNSEYNALLSGYLQKSPTISVIIDDPDYSLTSQTKSGISFNVLHDELLCDVLKSRAKAAARVDAIAIYRRIIRDNLSFERVNEWVSCFYGPIDNLKTVYHNLIKGDLNQQVRSKFEQYIMSTNDATQIMRDIGAAYNQHAAASWRDFRIKARNDAIGYAMDEMDKLPSGNGQVPNPTINPVLTVANFVDLTDLMISGTDLVFAFVAVGGAEAAPETEGTSLAVTALATAILTCNGVVEIVKQDGITDEARSSLQQMPLKHLYGKGGIFETAEIQIDTRFGRLSQSILAGGLK